MAKKDTMTWWRKKCVKVAKDIAKERDNYTCQRCMKRVKGANCHGSHVIAENRNKRLSCDPDNIKTLCYSCHKNFRHLQPFLSAKWFEKKFPDRAEYLRSENRKSNGSIGKQYFIDKLEELEKQLHEMKNGKAPDNSEFIQSLLNEVPNHE